MHWTAEGRGALQAVVAYPGVMPATTQVVRALLEAGMLARFETTFAYFGTGLIARSLHRAGGLGQRIERQLSRRKLIHVPPEVVHRAPAWDLARSAASALGADELLLDRIWERMLLDFDTGVARRLGRGVNVIYGYEHACLASFERAAQLGIKRVFDMAAPHYSVAEALQREQAPELVTRHRRGTLPLAAERNARKQAELDAADLVIANSAFTARTLIGTGYPAAKVRVVPLGAPPIDGGWRSAAPSSSVRFLYAGQVAVHKGVQHLLAAWRAVAPRAGAELLLAGTWLLPESLRQALPEGVRVLGRLPQGELFELYRTCSALVFPSLADGFGMVVTEALAHGLPVITTRNAGACDLIEDAVNGWVVDAGDVDALAARLAWCIDHADALRAMRQAAEATAARNQWSDYRLRLVAALREALAGNGHG